MMEVGVEGKYKLGKSRLGKYEVSFVQKDNVQ